MMEFEEEFECSAKLKVIGVGGAGGNAINNMIAANLEGIEFIAANTDAQALSTVRAENRIQLGPGLGAGSNPEVGREAAQESIKSIEDNIGEADMIFITAGMGGGTGTGASPIIAQKCREKGALTIGVVTKPFDFEGKRRTNTAQAGIEELKRHVDSLIILPNQRIFSVAGKNTTLRDAFKKADEVLLHAVQGIVDLINETGYVNLDFADVRTVMGERGMALMGMGSARGEERAREAANSAIMSPLLEDMNIAGAKGILINITGDETMTIHEVEEASKIISDAASEDANVKVGMVIRADTGGLVTVTVIATGFEAFQDAKRLKAVYNREKDLEVPTYKRAQSGDTIETVKKRTLTRLAPFGDESEDDYDIPAFLRKQMD